MAINKVVYGDQTLIDLTGDTVEASNLLEGETAHTRSGSPVTGTAKQGHIIKDADGTEMTQRPAIKFADADVSDDSTNQQTVVEVMHDPITRQSFEDAQNLDDGLYPIEGDDDNTVLSSDMISHGNGTVEQAIDGKVNKSGDTMSGNLTVDVQNGTTSSLGASLLTLGNSLGSGVDKNSIGIIDLYSETGKRVRLYAKDDISALRYIRFPNASGIVALTSDIPVPQLTSKPKTGMAAGWYVVWDLSTSWATDVSLWIQVVSGTHVYVWTQNTLVTLA